VVVFLSLSRFLSYILAHKLKPLKGDLRVWNEEVFGNVERKKKLILEDLRVLEVLEEGRVLSEEEKLRKVMVINDLGGQFFWRR
jgi:hypothetical protein